MTNTITAGNRGKRARGDCFVSFEPAASGKLDIEINSSVQQLYGNTIKNLAHQVFGLFGLTSGRVLIEDTGALDFVLAARIEACITQAIETKKSFLGEMLQENCYSSQKNRMRLSRLYLPGNSPKMMINAGVHQPNAIILDLEDSVAVSKKREARFLVRNALRQIDFLGAERMVRINQLPMGLDDLPQVIPHNVHVILIPKCESAETVHQINQEIARINAADKTDREVFLMPIIESSKGIFNAAEIAGSADNIVAITIGLEDFTADIGVKRTFEGTESFYARSHLVNICKCHNIQAIDSVFSDVGNMDALAQTIRHSKSIGFEGMGCIHPRQIPIIHAGYSPDPADIDKAKKIVLAFDEATKNGLGVVSLGSKMIDPPVVERAQQTIDQAVTLNILSENWRAENV